MKKSFIGKVALSLVFVMGLSTVAFGAPSATTESAISSGGGFYAKSTVQGAIFRLVVPTEVPFKLDPFNLSDSTYSVLGETYGIINKSNVAINLNVKATISGSGVTVKRLGKVNTTNPSNLVKEVAVAIVPAASKTNVLTSSGSITSSAINYTTTSPFDFTAPVMASNPAFYATLNTVAASVTPATMSFALEATSYGAVLADRLAAADATMAEIPETSLAIFSLRGQINPFATWKNTDFSVRFAYDFVGLSDANFAATNFLDPTLASGVAFAASSTNLDPTFTLGTAGLKYSLSATPKPVITMIVVPGTTGVATPSAIKFDATALTLDTDYKYAGASKTITFLTAGAIQSLTPGAHNITIMFDDIAVVKQLEVVQ